MLLFGSQFTTLAGSASLPLCGDRNERVKVEERWNSNSNISSREKTEVHPMFSVGGMAPLSISYKKTVPTCSRTAFSNDWNRRVAGGDSEAKAKTSFCGAGTD